MTRPERTLRLSFTTHPTTASAEEIALAVYRAVGALGVVIVDRAVEFEQVGERRWVEK